MTTVPARIAAALAAAAAALPAGPVAAQPKAPGAGLSEAAQQIVEQGLAQMSQRAALFGPPTRALAGRFAGIAACGPVVLTAQLDVAVSPTGVVTGRYSQRPSAGGERAVPPVDHGVTLGYDPLTGAVVINPEVAVMTDRSRPQLARTLGQVIGDGSTIVAAAARTGPTAGCTPWTFKRAGADDWRHVEEAAGSGAPGSGGRRPGLPIFQLGDKLKGLFGGGCTDLMVRWVAQLGAEQGVGASSVEAQWNLFTDPYFVPFFERPFRALSAGDRESIGKALRTECPKSAAYRNASRLLVNGVVEAFTDTPGTSRATVHATNIAQAELRRFVQLTTERARTVGEQGATPELVDQFVRTVEPLVALLWGRERAAFDEAMRQARVDIGYVAWRKRIEAGGGTTASALDTLEQTARALAEARRPPTAVPGRPPLPVLALAPAQWDELERTLAATLDREVPGAAAMLAAGMRAPVEADLLRRWTENFPNVATRLSPAARAALQRSFDERHDAIEAETAAREKATLQATLASAAPPLQQLGQLVAQDVRADQLLTPYLKGANWAAHQRDAAQARQRLLAQAGSEITRQLPQQRSRRELEALLAAYVRPVDRDSEPGRVVMAAARQRLAVIAPFGALPAGEYLDALYAGDFRTAAQLDAAYGASIRDGVRAGTNVILGKPADARHDPLGEAYLAWITGPGFSLSAALASLYIVNFESVYRGCLGNPPREITIHTTTYESGRNAFGIPFERNLGTTTRRVLVKAELADFAMTINLDDPGLSARLSDFLRRRETLGASDVVAGTRALMTTFACTDARVLQFESRLVEYVLSARRR